MITILLILIIIALLIYILTLKLATRSLVYFITKNDLDITDEDIKECNKYVISKLFKK